MSKRSIIFISLALSFLLVLVMSVQIIGFKKAVNSNTVSPDMVQEIKPYDLTVTVGGLIKKCGNSTKCFLDNLNTITADYGPQTALDSLEKLQAKNIIPPSMDDHHIAHEIGRQTAKNFGINQEAFLLCPLSAYNGGCQHGFFEYVLGKTESQTEAANMICASLDESFSSKFKFYCYHGIGHGIMMAQAYDLDQSLAICDSLSDKSHIEGCWQGVFMENTNSAMRGEARTGIFSKDEPLIPCNKIDDKYRYQCFINHSGWLMRVFNNDIAKASQACLKAPLGYINSCIQSLGLMTTNSSWQTAITHSQTDKSLQQIGWEICNKFPTTHIDQCVIGGVDNIMNFNELNASEAGSFCKLVEKKYENLCYGKIGSNLRFQSNDNSLVINQCNTLGEPGSELCKIGANLKAN